MSTSKKRGVGSVIIFILKFIVFFWLFTIPFWVGLNLLYVNADFAPLSIDFLVYYLVGVGFLYLSMAVVLFIFVWTKKRQTKNAILLKKIVYGITIITPFIYAGIYSLLRANRTDVTTVMLGYVFGFLAMYFIIIFIIAIKYGKLFSKRNRN